MTRLLPSGRAAWTPTGHVGTLLGMLRPPPSIPSEIQRLHRDLVGQEPDEFRRA
jgi:hypothetical protein